MRAGRRGSKKMGRVSCIARLVCILQRRIGLRCGLMKG